MKPFLWLLIPLHDDRSIPGFTKEESNGIFNDKVKKK